MSDKGRLQAGQYRFPYHYLVGPDAGFKGSNPSWELDYYTYMNRVVDLVHRHHRGEVLDVGCGDGYLLNRLAVHEDMGPFTGLGIDIDRQAIAFANSFAMGKENVSFRVDDIRDFDRSSSLITLIETLEHIPDDFLETFCSEVDRLLKPGGKLIISVPSKNLPLIPKHFRHFDVGDIDGLFPGYTREQTSFVSARGNPVFWIIAHSLCGRHLNLDFQPFRSMLLAIHRRFTSSATEHNGAHIVTVLHKSD